jgi:glycosyltransferase involved in cell wall biosynthesis
VGVYSREILNGLAAAEPERTWEWFYRSQRYWRARAEPRPANVRRRFLTESWGSRAAHLFHGLNQRLPSRRFPRQISTFHDLFVLTGDYSTKEFRERFARQAREAAAASDLIIAVSDFTARQVESLLHVPSSRIRVIHHGVLPRPIPQLKREKIVLCVGAIQRRKNQAALVKAFAAMPEEWRLVLAGSQGFGAEETMSAIEASPARARIRVTGYVSDAELAEWYAKAGIFAFPSLDEGFGMPVLEAMSAGIPVITSNRSSMPEIAGDASLLVDPTDLNALSDALLSLHHRQDFAAQLSKVGRNHAGLFTWEKAIARTAAVYREFL